MERQNEVVLPRLISPRTIVYLWILLGFLGIAMCLAWLVRVPIYATGKATVVHSSNLSRSLSLQDDMVLLVFLPATQQVHVGQKLLVQWDAASSYLESEVVFVEPDIVSPGDARQRFRLDDGAALAVTQPSRVVIASFVPTTSELATSFYDGGLFSILIDVGSRRVISLLPVIGRFLE